MHLHSQVAHSIRQRTVSEYECGDCARDQLTSSEKSHSFASFFPLAVHFLIYVRTILYRLCKKSHTTPRIYSHLITSCPYLIKTVIFHISPQCANTLFTLVSFPSGARVFPFHMRVPYCGGLDIRRDRNAS